MGGRRERSGRGRLARAVAPVGGDVAAPPAADVALPERRTGAALATA